MVTTRRYYSEDDHAGKTPSGLKRLSRTKQREYLLYWFHKNYEDPVEQTPYETAEGGYQYIWGGPYDANEVLGAEFGDVIPYALISSVAEEVESEGTIDWAPGSAHPNMQRRREEAEADEFEWSNEPPRRWPTQGVFTAHVAAGNAVGKPIDEPAHITPRYPQGIKDSDLWTMDRAIQMETALWWFLLNLEPYDAEKAAARFGRVRFGDSFSRPAVEARNVLNDEFKSVLLPQLIEDVAGLLGGLWMWKTQPILSVNMSPANTSEVFSALIPVLDSLFSAIIGIPRKPSHGGIGHNGPPSDAPLSNKDRDELIFQIAQAKRAAYDSSDEGPSKFLKAWDFIKKKVDALSQWAQKQIDTLVTNFVAEAGKSAGKVVGPAILIFLIGQYAPVVSHFHVGDSIVKILLQLMPH